MFLNVMALIVILPVPTAKHCEFSFACFLLICHFCVFAVEDTGRQSASEREAFDARNILKVGGSSVTQFRE